MMDGHVYASDLERQLRDETARREQAEAELVAYHEADERLLAIWRQVCAERDEWEGEAKRLGYRRKYWYDAYHTVYGDCAKLNEDLRKAERERYDLARRLVEAEADGAGLRDALVLARNLMRAKGYSERDPLGIGAINEALAELYVCDKCGAAYTDPETLGKPWRCNEGYCDGTLKGQLRPGAAAADRALAARERGGS